MLKLANVVQGHADVYKTNDKGQESIFVGYIEQKSGTKQAGWYSYDCGGKLLSEFPAAKRQHALLDYKQFETLKY